MDVLYNEDHSHYAVLVSPGFGAGWSTWNYKELAYDKRVVEWYLEKVDCHPVYCMRLNDPNTPERAAASELLASWGYGDVYFGGLQSNMLRWVPTGVPWRMAEYDGNESIEFLKIDDYNCFN